MQCPHCRVNFHDKPDFTNLGSDNEAYWSIESYQCSACMLKIFYLYSTDNEAEHNKIYIKFDVTIGGTESDISDKSPQTSRTLIRPKGSSCPPCPSEVPKEIAEDYNEACLVLIDSPKASAALSRRCLESLLNDAANVNPKNDLIKKIQEVIESNTLPSQLVKIIDAVRVIGNYAAHPKKSISTGLILPVEPEEAEWNLTTLEALFDYYYVLPKQNEERLKKLEEKKADSHRRG